MLQNLLWIIFVITRLKVVTAFPNGAAQCVTNGVSVGGTHQSNVPLTTPSFEEQGYLLVLNVGNRKSETILSTNSRFGLTVGGSYSISLIANGTATFRGALIRFSEDLGTMEAGLNARLAEDTCGPFPAVTHVDNTNKTILTGMMTFDVVGTGTVLCDVVEFNNAIDGSSYSFQQYQIEVLEPKPGTMAPAMGLPQLVPMPTLRPIILPPTARPQPVPMPLSTIGPPPMTQMPATMNKNTAQNTPIRSNTTSNINVGMLIIVSFHW